MKALDSLWPSEELLNSTLGTDAHTLDTSVFLAVHQPMRFRRVGYGNNEGDAPIVGEEDMLEALLADDGEGRVIIPIAGPSGAGKSHVVKWLEAKLNSRDDAECRHVILVPKSASLKSVLKLILRDLDGPRYDEIRESLERASDSLPEVAAKDLRTRLVASLRSEAKAAKERLRDGSSENLIADKQAEWGPGIADLLEDPELWTHHFYGNESKPSGVIARLAENVNREGSANRRHQFEPDDFRELTSNVGVNDLGRRARGPIGRLVDIRYRRAAADVLNRVLDQATQNLLDLGGTPLSEVFLELRRALLEDNKELVILVEDFAALSGMQGALLDALIHEARVGGRQEYCTIRSALAYTLGYQPMDRNTVRTRARAEWIIEDVPGVDEEILDRAVELVSAYWNAARWGTDELKNQHEQGVDQVNWIQCYKPVDISEDELSIINGFGHSHAGYPLFPLNVSAIRQLVREKSYVNGRLVFNPRLIIDRVVLDVGKLRRSFEKGAFPPLSLGNATLTTADVVQVINQQPVDQQQQVLTLVTYWAELPDSLTEAARLPKAVYQAFGLQPADFGSPPPDSPPQPLPLEKKVGKPKDPLPAVEDSFTSEWKPVLDAWLEGKRLNQTRARNLRNWICEAILNTLPHDWPGSRPWVDKGGLAKDHTYIPNALGASGLEEANAAVSLCDDDIWSDPLSAAPIRQALEAIIRFHGISATKGTWNYSGAEIYAARYANFVAERRGKLLEWFAAQRAAQQKQRGFQLDHLVENRLMAAAILGVGVKGGNQLESAISVLFMDLPDPNPDPHFPERWQRLLNEAKRHAELSRKDLIEIVASRQGIAGSKVLAIDTACIHEPVQEFLKKWTLSDGPKDQNNFTSLIKRGVSARQDQLKKWHADTIQWLGKGFDKAVVIADIRELLTEARSLGLSHVDGIEAARGLLLQFRDIPVADTLKYAEQALREPLDGIALPALAYDYTKVIQVTTELGERLQQLFDDIERGIESTLATSGLVELQQMKEQVATELEEVQHILERHEEIRSYEYT